MFPTDYDDLQGSVDLTIRIALLWALSVVDHPEFIMKSLLPVRPSRTYSIVFLAFTALTTHSVFAGPISEAEALARAASVPDAMALDVANRDAATADAQAVRRFENPEIHVSRERVSGSLGTETELTADITQPLGINGVTGRLRAAAQAEAQAVEADITRGRAVRAAEVRKSYAECAASTERLTILIGQDARLREVERIISLRAGVGDAAGYDLRRVRLEARSVSVQKALADGEVRATCATLSRLTSEPDARPREPLFALLQPIRPALEATNSRSDLEAQRYRVSAAEAQAGAARRQRIPDLAVGAGYKRISEGGLSASGATISLAIKLPIFNGNGASRAADARKRAAEADLALSSSAIAAEREAAFARAVAAYEAAILAQSSAEDASRVADIADAAYQGGETDITDLIDGYRAAAEAQTAAVEIAERAAKARAEHLLAQQGEE
jgi:cobalt-zinc-cadmium efflux system outer membrane protein